MTMANEGADGLSQVREGMQVVDRVGGRLGTVELVAMGDPEAVTTQGQEAARPGQVYQQLLQAVFGREPRIPEQFHEQLVREGFVKIDSKGLLDRDAYATASQVGAVEGETVHLTVTEDDLIYEG